MARDFGFAPNPFGGYCTLCTCKPYIRKHANVNDWIIGTGARSRYNLSGQLIYAMKVTEKMSFNEYYEDPRFQYKKPIFNGSLKQCFGDNIYFKPDDEDWVQLHSHHSHGDGSINHHNLNRDTGTTSNILVSNLFYYFGSANVTVPRDFSEEVCINRIGQKELDGKIGKDFIKWLEDNYAPMIHGDPLEFDKGFQHYDGIN